MMFGMGLSSCWQAMRDPMEEPKCGVSSHEFCKLVCGDGSLLGQI